MSGGVQTILGGRSDTNIRFDELRALMRYLGFDGRVRGSHHIFDKEGVAEVINLQSRGGHAKRYQVKQVSAVDTQVQVGRLMYKYEIILYWSNEDEAYVAEVPELPGCMAHGADQESALRKHQGRDAVSGSKRVRELGTPRTGAQGRAPHAHLTRVIQPSQHPLARVPAQSQI